MHPRFSRSNGSAPPAAKSQTEVFMPLIAAVLGIVGVMVGAFVQGYTTLHSQAEKTHLEQKVLAYTEFTAAQAAYMRADPAKISETEKDAIDLKIRAAALKILLFSDAKTVSSLARYIQVLRERSVCPEITEVDVRTYQAMRQDVQQQAAQAVADSDAAMVVFGCSLQ
jgi:hypothetical protein